MKIKSYQELKLAREEIQALKNLIPEHLKSKGTFEEEAAQVLQRIVNEVKDVFYYRSGFANTKEIEDLFIEILKGKDLDTLPEKVTVFNEMDPFSIEVVLPIAALKDIKNTTKQVKYYQDRINKVQSNIDEIYK